MTEITANHTAYPEVQRALEQVYQLLYCWEHPEEATEDQIRQSFYIGALGREVASGNVRLPNAAKNSQNTRQQVDK